MYEPYDYKKESKIKKFLNNIRDRLVAFKQELHFREMGPNKWIIVFIPLTLLLLVGLTYTGYVTYTGRVAEAQSKIMVMERQMEGLQSELDRTSIELSQCSSDLDTTKRDLALTKTSLEETRKNVEICSYEREDLLTQLDDKQEELNNWITKYNILETNYNNLERNWAQSKGCLFYRVSGSFVECVVPAGEGKYLSVPAGATIPADQVKQV